MLYQGLGVGDEAGVESVAGSVGVFVIAAPSFERGALERAGVGEGDRPGEGALVSDGLEIFCGLFDALAAGEEDNASEIFGDVFLEDFGCPFADFFRGGLSGVLAASENHVDF